MASRHRILTISHGHPDFSLGGGEIAAYNLYQAYAQDPSVEDAWFLARFDGGRGATGAISPRRAGEYLWEQKIGDWFRFGAAHKDSVFRGFAKLIAQTRPTVVHTHHYVHLGLEYLAIIKQIDPSIKIVMTLHEFLAICQNQGQMVKTNGTNLCFQSSLLDCQRCFPDRSAEDFWLRRHRFQSFLGLVDEFVAPSHFLRQRYIDWGLSPEKITVIENGQADRDPIPPRPLPDGAARNRFGFFGQINPYKGLEVVLRGLCFLPTEDREKIVLEVHGANLESQSQEFQDRVAKLRDELEPDGVIQWIGPYEPFQMPSRVAEIDWVIIPSIWWENSPMVIQEAFTLGRPVLGSDIGGMAEKITDGKDGLHVPVGNAVAWGQTMLRLAESPEEWDRLRSGIKPPITHAQCANAHIKLFQVIEAA